MRRLQIYIDEAIDEVLDVASRREGRSKASLIRQALRLQYPEASETDPLDDWIGSIDADPADIDATVYGE